MGIVTSAMFDDALLGERAAGPGDSELAERGDLARPLAVRFWPREAEASSVGSGAPGPVAVAVCRRGSGSLKPSAGPFTALAPAATPVCNGVCDRGPGSEDGGVDSCRGGCSGDDCIVSLVDVVRSSWLDAEPRKELLCDASGGGLAAFVSALLSAVVLEVGR